MLLIYNNNLANSMLSNSCLLIYANASIKKLLWCSIVLEKACITSIISIFLTLFYFVMRKAINIKECFGLLWQSRSSILLLTLKADANIAITVCYLERN